MAPPSYEEIRRFVDFRLLPPRICLPLNRGAEGRNEIRRKPRLEQEAGVSLIEFRLIVLDEYISISKFRCSIAFSRYCRGIGSVTWVETVVHDSGGENSGSIILCRLMAGDGNREQWNDGRAWNSKDPEENFWPIGASISSKRIKADPRNTCFRFLAERIFVRCCFFYKNFCFNVIGKFKREREEESK